MSSKQTTSVMGIVGRLFWMMAGPMLLVVLVFQIIDVGSGWATPVDLAYLLVLGSMIAGRWLEFRGGNPQTATGEPAGPGVLRRYALVTSAVGLAVWAMANIVGNYVMEA